MRIWPGLRTEYTLTPQRVDGAWRVARIVLHTTDQEGDRSLPNQATARAAGHDG